MNKGAKVSKAPGDGSFTEYRFSWSTWQNRALALDPNYTTAHHNLGVMLARTGRSEEGMAGVDALRAEPRFKELAHRRD